MHTEMWEHPAVQDNLATLRRRGVIVVDPGEGRLAGGDIGVGRLADVGDIVDAAERALGSASAGSDLDGLRVLVTAGGTREAIDPVRVITNRSSGKQGYAVAERAQARGAKVTLVTTVDRPAPVGIEVIEVTSAAEMQAAVLPRSGDHDVIVMAAAVADFRPAVVADHKIKKGVGLPEIVLEPTHDFLVDLGSTKPAGQTLVGFAAETDDLVANARQKLERKGLDLIVANDVLGARGRLRTRHQRGRDHRCRRDRPSCGAERQAVDRRRGARCRRGLAPHPPDRWPPERRSPDRHRTGDIVSSWTFTSESVTEGHPDKMADQISDAILDAMLDQDPMSRVACETFVTTGLAIVGGEITTNGYVDIPKIVRGTINEIGYNRESYGYDGNTVGVLVSLDEQSPDIAQGVDDSEEVRSGSSGEDLLNKQGAGDQGMMFGYACDETDVLMPLPIHLAHRMAERLSEVRRAGTVPYLRPDGKTQVTFDYTDGRPTRLRTVLISTQHNDGIDRDEVIRPDLIEHVIRPVVPAEFADDDYEVYINPTGRFVIGGPVGDAGLTGRKIIVDTYGGMGRHGGGAFSGKDPSKVDRSAAYAARWVAKNVVAAGAASRCEVQVAYAIGVARPISVLVETFGTEKVDNTKIVEAISNIFDLRPAAILRDLDLRRPIYKRTAAYGHFGRPAEDGGFTWERTDKVDDLRSALGL